MLRREGANTEKQHYEMVVKLRKINRTKYALPCSSSKGEAVGVINKSMEDGRETMTD